ncbi:hypothetical protein PUN28_020651 [Cardiocondyla obscurior]
MGEVEEENRENPEEENEEESASEGDFMTEMQQMFDQMFSEIGDDVAITEVTTEITNQTMHCRIFFYYTNDYLFYCIPCFMDEQLLVHEDFKMVRCHRTETYEVLLIEQVFNCDKCNNSLAIIINSDMCQSCNP